MLVAILIFLPHRFSVGLELGKDSPKSKTLIFLFVPWARSPFGDSGPVSLCSLLLGLFICLPKAEGNGMIPFRVAPC